MKKYYRALIRVENRLYVYGLAGGLALPRASHVGL